MDVKKVVLNRPVQGKSDVELETAIHPHPNGTIVVSMPGLGAELDGYNNVYGQLADIIRQNDIGAVVRMDNQECDAERFPFSMLNNFRFLVDYAIQNSVDICDAKNPVIYMMGMSAGGSTVAAVVSEFPDVEKILLLAPFGDANMGIIQKGLVNYKGEMHVATGDRDLMVPPAMAETYIEVALSAKIKKFEVIPDCDHFFTSKQNGMVMSKAPLWAFANEKTFPSHKGGINLYG